MLCFAAFLFVVPDERQSGHPGAHTDAMVALMRRPVFVVNLTRQPFLLCIRVTKTVSMTQTFWRVTMNSWRSDPQSEGVQYNREVRRSGRHLIRKTWGRFYAQGKTRRIRT